ncbi:pterin 4 alpha carbinolamine dehydratase-domain-containing protein [Microdochium trichocladiopsis]|uniref:4a-hydroxytetrahydrobiopterin dehydratase n=1 Tax=Microdochium trichocladiopsis TaxID=1682393 RepID=A0A9P8YC56_9PEZI|nr:pterin 4 alpha carbinolamine dehydratase-domain-containing protein [Microdochium trichocladiopsis]KAH7035572.1 pterin 4 alpha carbinolamine dehydratase-domain-containing protein [Microdochium trichocladiopsis]
MSSTQAIFSRGTDEQAMNQKLQSLLAGAGQGGRWTLISSGQGLERSFKFKTFAKTWDFMTAVSLQCKIKNHHPEWSNVYNTTYIRWTTHEPKGLSDKDIELAAICDQLARDFGEQATPPSQLPAAGDDKVSSSTTGPTEAESGQDAISCQIRGLADRVASGAGADCCVPTKNRNQ